MRFSPSLSSDTYFTTRGTVVGSRDVGHSRSVIASRVTCSMECQCWLDGSYLCKVRVTVGEAVLILTSPPITLTFPPRPHFTSTSPPITPISLYITPQSPPITPISPHHPASPHITSISPLPHPTLPNITSQSPPITPTSPNHPTSPPITPISPHHPPSPPR